MLLTAKIIFLKSSEIQHENTNNLLPMTHKFIIPRTFILILSKPSLDSVPE